MIRIAIVDDTGEIRALIGETVEKIMGKDVRISGYERAETLLEDLKDEFHFDIFLVDIKMPGMDGLKLAEEIRRYEPSGFLVFITSYSHYAIQGYDYKAYAFIDKSMREQKLEEVLLRIKKELGNQTQDAYYIQTESRLEKIRYRDIIYLKKEGKNVFFITENGICRERESLEKMLGKMDREELIQIDRGDGSEHFAHCQSVRKYRVYGQWRSVGDQP